MPQLADVVVTDRASTPVDHTFHPRDISGGVATVAESSGVPIGDNTLTFSLTRTPSNRYKVVMKGRFPVVQTQTINGIDSPAVVRIANAEVTFNFDATSTEQERKDCVGMIADALAADQTVLNPLFTKLQAIY
jgi:hypothetical protein